MTKSETKFDYNGWKGNGDSQSSAHLTWMTALWLSNEPDSDQETQRLVCAHPEDEKAGDALREFTEAYVMSDLMVHTGLSTHLLSAVLQDEINWTEIAASFRGGNCDDTSQSIE